MGEESGPLAPGGGTGSLKVSDLWACSHSVRSSLSQGSCRVQGRKEPRRPQARAAAQQPRKSVHGRGLSFIPRLFVPTATVRRCRDAFLVWPH